MTKIEGIVNNNKVSWIVNSFYRGDSIGKIHVRVENDETQDEFILGKPSRSHEVVKLSKFIEERGSDLFGEGFDTRNLMKMTPDQLTSETLDWTKETWIEKIKEIIKAEIYEKLDKIIDRSGSKEEMHQAFGLIWELKF